jgi:hypothetical protein
LRSQEPLQPKIFPATGGNAFDGYHVWESALQIPLVTSDTTVCPYEVRLEMADGSVVTSGRRQFTLVPSRVVPRIHVLSDVLGEVEMLGDTKVLRVLSTDKLPSSLQANDSTPFFEQHREELASVPLFCPIRLVAIQAAEHITSLQCISIQAAPSYPGDWRDILHWFISADQSSTYQTPVTGRHLELVQRYGRIPCPVSFPSAKGADIPPFL